MAIIVKDLFQYDANFDPKKIKRLTGKSDYKKTDTVDLSRLAAENDKNLSVFVAKKEGKSFVNYITDDNMKTQVADASGIKNDKQTEQNSQNAVLSQIPMDKSIFDYRKPEMA